MRAYGNEHWTRERERETRAAWIGFPGVAYFSVSLRVVGSVGRFEAEPPNLLGPGSVCRFEAQPPNLLGPEPLLYYFT